jgi:hypothetical protein
VGAPFKPYFGLSGIPQHSTSGGSEREVLTQSLWPVRKCFQTTALAAEGIPSAYLRARLPTRRADARTFTAVPFPKHCSRNPASKIVDASEVEPVR